MKKTLLLIGIALLLPISTKALETTNFERVAEETKYYKVTTYKSNYNLLNVTFPKSITTEISKTEYENVNTTILPLSTSVETTYKKMTTTILSNGTKFKYDVLLTWKLIPSTRSYDIIGIGHYPSVKLSGNISFILNYRTPNGTHSSNAGTIYTGNSGTSVIFKIPDGTLNSLSARLSFDVAKASDATVLTQKAFGDYAHAVKNITLNNAKNHTVNTNGIVLSNSISEYYDSISTATAVWNGRW